MNNRNKRPRSSSSSSTVLEPFVKRTKTAEPKLPKDQNPSLEPDEVSRNASDDVMEAAKEKLWIGEYTADVYFGHHAFELVWRSPAAPSDDCRGDFSSRYQLTRQIGEGHFGQVFEARRRSDGRLFAVKIFSESLMERALPVMRSTNPAVKTVPTEMNALVELAGVPGVVQLEEAHASRTWQYLLVMELVPGVVTLSEHLKSNGWLSEPEAYGYFVQIVRTLKAMRQRRRHHMDLKDTNILLDRSTGKTIVIDFGGAQRAIGRRYRKWVGTKCFFPPEFREDNKLFGLASDVWSLGLLLYRMTAGTLPLDIPDSTAACDTPRMLSDDLKELVDKCLERQPRKRARYDQILKSDWVTRMQKLTISCAI